MGKKKGKINIKGVGLIFTGLVVVVLLAPLLLLLTGTEVPIIGKVYGDILGIDTYIIDPQSFEIPITTPQQEQTVKELADENEDLIHNEISPLEGCIDFSLELIDPETEEFCRQLLEDALNKFKENEMMIDEIIPEPINKNQTDFSEDDPLKQILDETENPTSPTVQLLLNVNKIDSQGNSTEAVTNFGLSPFDFLVQEDSNRDFRTGLLEFTAILKAEPESSYSGDGLVDVLIGNVTIFEEPIPIKFNGMTDSEGFLKIDFLSPTGLVIKKINLDFNKNFDKFTNEEITQIIFKIINLDIIDKSAMGMDFSVIDAVAFTMEVARNDFKIVITNEDGGTQRIFTPDSRLIIQGIPTKVIATSCYTSWNYISRTSTGTTITSYVSDPTHPLGCIPEREPIIFTHSTQNTNVFGLTLFDSNNQFIKTNSGGTGIVFDELLQRNTNYTLIIASPEITSELSYPKAQQTKSFTCENEYDIKYRTVKVEGSKTYRTHSASWSHLALVVDVVTIKQVNCNLVETLG